MKPRRVLVTGGGSGIGLAMARAFQGLGDQVLISGSRSTLADVAAELSRTGPQVRAYVADLASEEQTLALAAETLRVLGGCDVLVNCAGLSQKRNGAAIPPTEITNEDWNRVIRINLTSPFLLCRELIPSMQKNGWGRIVNVASRGGRTFVPFAGADYATSKAGLIGMTRHLAGVYAPDQITVNAIAPGRIDTPQAGQSSDAIKAMATKAIPAGRFGTPDEIAALAVFLASEQASYITGTCIDANGGAFMA